MSNTSGRSGTTKPAASWPYDVYTCHAHYTSRPWMPYRTKPRRKLPTYQNTREQTLRILPGKRKLVRMTQCSVRDLHTDFPSLWWRNLHIHNLQRLFRSKCNSSPARDRASNGGKMSNSKLGKRGQHACFGGLQRARIARIHKL
jgi:hypothetical protein